MAKKIKAIIRTEFLVLLGFIVSLSTYPPSDPDLWWHLKVGEQIWSGSFPFEDAFSFSMAGYKWVDHEWLTDAIMFRIFQMGGLLLLGLIFIAIFIAAFVLAIRVGKTLYPSQSEKSSLLVQLFTLFIALLACNAILGTRPQMISLLGFALVNLILWQYVLQQKDKTHILPIIFLIWANTHGGYLVGLLLIFFFLTTSLIALVFFPKISNIFPDVQTVAKTRKLSLILVACILACMCNPYGVKIFTESFNTSLDTYARQNIAEWQPVNIQEIWGVLFFIYLAIACVGIFLQKKKLFLNQITQFPIFAYLALSSSRHVPFFILFSLPVVYGSLNNHWQNRSHASENLHRIFAFRSQKPFALLLNTLLSISVAALFFARLLDFGLSSTNLAYLDQQNENPRQAVDFLIQDQNSINTLNFYGWGGYLIWNSPEKKVFIDGRMASWADQNTHILQEYHTLVNLGPGWLELLAKYNIDTVFLPPDSPLINTLPVLQDWDLLYTDDIAVIVRRT